MSNASEEAKMIDLENSSQVLTAYSKVPYSLINGEVEDDAKDILDELTEICKYYKIYKEGEQFTTEGTGGYYVPAMLRYKLVSTLINKEARFLFAEAPRIQVGPKGDVGAVTPDAEDALTVLNDLITTVFDVNNFEGELIKGARDCFIGKRIAMMANFNEEDGITITFLPSTQFIYETRMGNPSVLTKFICFIVVKESKRLSSKLIFKKKYVLDEDTGEVWLSEGLYDGLGQLVEDVTEPMKIELDRIPVVVVVNDGLTGESQGVSEVELLKGYEQWYSKLSNADIDAERKSMNPVRYSVDMDQQSTKNLSSSAGSFWDLMSDQNLDHPSPSVGLLESSMNFSESLKTTLDRIKQSAYEQIDMPIISLDSLHAAITTGKGLKAIYWSLIVRCSEKMKSWGPQIQNLVEIIIDGALAYPNVAVQHTDDIISEVAYQVTVEAVTPLPEDETEQKTMDLNEVQTGVRSRKSYMMKWMELTEDEVQEELEQMALEREMLEEVQFGVSATSWGGAGSNESVSDGQLPDDTDEAMEDEEEGAEGALDASEE